MKIVTSPLTVEEVKQRVDENNRVEGIIEVSLENEIVGKDMESFLDMISEKLVVYGALHGLSYGIVGHKDADTLYIQLSGDVTTLLEEEECYSHEDGEE
jgi:hypothetical protein